MTTNRTRVLTQRDQRQVHMLLQGHIDCGDSVACLRSHAGKGTAEAEVLHFTDWAVRLLLQAVLKLCRATGHTGWQAVLSLLLQHIACVPKQSDSVYRAASPYICKQPEL